MYGNFGHHLYNNTANTVLPIGNLGTRNIAKSLIGGDVQENISNPITPSTRYLEKGNFMKMANVTLSYNLGDLWNTFKNVTVSLTGQNLFVITDYSGFDPEVTSGNDFNFRIDGFRYPNFRQISAQVELRF